MKPGKFLLFSLFLFFLFFTVFSWEYYWGQKTVTDSSTFTEKDDEYSDSRKTARMLREAISLIRTDETDSALELLDSVLALEPGLRHALNNKGYAYEKKGVFDSSVAYYMKAYNADSSYSVPLYNAANVYLKTGEPEKAIDLYKAYFAAGGNIKGSYLNMSSALSLVKKYEEASKILLKGWVLYPEDPEICVNRAVLMESLNRDSAAFIWEKCTAILKAKGTPEKDIKEIQNRIRILRGGR
ncbi:MAG: tetratricopeptide repeat protein [Fibrobacterota bacterium]